MAMGWLGSLIIGLVIAFPLFCGGIAAVIAAWLGMQTDDLRQKIEGEEEDEG